MRTIPSLRGQAYLRRIGVVLIAIALVAAVVSCDGVVVEYDLTIGSSAGGQVTDPGEGTFTYDDGDVVDLVATPDCGYVFDNWTGDTGTIDDVNAASTNITMNADYDINANFKVKPLSHFKGYYVDELTAPYMDQTVTLTDQFVQDFVVEVGEASWFFNPTEKVHLGETTPIFDGDHHLAVYNIYYEGSVEGPYPVNRSVEVTNQFGTQNVSVFGPVALAVPTRKVEPGNHEQPQCLDHFLLYAVELEYMEEIVDLKDQFGTDENVVVYAPYFFANPVQKTDATGVTEIEVARRHLLIYAMDGTTASYDQVQVCNQFATEQTFDLGYPGELLALPSRKDVPPTPPLDHFKCYAAAGSSLEGLYVYLEDQFGVYAEAQVFEPRIFCNPVDKVHDTLTANSNPDNHLTVYNIETTPKDWSVVVENQFGNGQELLVQGPVGLVVPTQKVEPNYHDKPKYLNHYLLYIVLEGLNVTATVDLDDQFLGDAKGVEVTQPVYFATPAVKGYVDHVSSPWDPEGHLVFYAISPNEEFYPDVYVNNQFAPDGTGLTLTNEQLLAVPSVKVEWSAVS
jgi:hypothetical protein